MTDTLPIIVHSGRMHADEVMASAILKLTGRWTPDQGVIRTRDGELIAANVGKAYIVDVGGVFDLKSKQFDHHQNTFNEYFCSGSQGKGVKMSSCGLVFQAYGSELFLSRGRVLTAGEIIEFYFRYIIEIDANDNGVDDLEKGSKYVIKPSFTLPAIIGRLNSTDVEDHEKQREQFIMAIGLCELLLKSAIENFLTLLDARREATEVCDRGEVILVSGYLIWVLDQQCDYQFDLKSRTARCFPNFQWVLTVLPRGNTGNYQIQTVNHPGEKFSRWVDLLEEAQAKNLIKDDLVFVHHNHFMAITKTKEGAMKLAKESIKMHFKKVSYGDGVCIAFFLEVVLLTWLWSTEPEWVGWILIFLFGQIGAAFFAMC